MISAGVDAGSRTIKVVLLDAERGELIAAGVVDQGIEQEQLAVCLLERLLAEQGRSRAEVRSLVATGCGRKLIGMADAVVTEITCQAWGVRRLLPQARTVVEIGGQDSKLLRLGPDGTVADFVMNDRCAAGTGRFLELVAAQLGVRLAVLGDLAAASRQPAIISNMCMVFAETEIIGLLGSGTRPADIVAGVQVAVASRIAAMAGQRLTPPVVFTGGVALVHGMDAALAQALNCPVNLAPQPQLTGALGAAVLAARRMSS
jgi:predicted CoA-substrate-specific enzyme activase